jgi:drug/metabolite transporter superfamily protein YnfA
MNAPGPLVEHLGAAAIFVSAAVLEVAGDALIRLGMRGGGIALGAHVAVFAIVSVVAGRVVFHDRVPWTTWAGLVVVLAGSLVIRLGRAA